jgi:hypothetical protein
MGVESFSHGAARLLTGKQDLHNLQANLYDYISGKHLYTPLTLCHANKKVADDRRPTVASFCRGFLEISGESNPLARTGSAPGKLRLTDALPSGLEKDCQLQQRWRELGDQTAENP